MTLIKSNLSNPSTCYLSLFPIPMGVANRLEKLQRDFLWGILNNGQLEMCVSLFNLTVWGSKTQSCSIRHCWGSSFGGLHLRERLFGGGWGSLIWKLVRRMVLKHISRSVWGTLKIIRKGWDGFHWFTSFKVGDGSLIKFCHDLQCDGPPLRNGLCLFFF